MSEKEYRPPNWENPYQDNEFWPECGRCFARYEAGADAMLKALRSKGVSASSLRSRRLPESETVTIPTLEKMEFLVKIEGMWVFIPDEQ